MAIVPFLVPISSLAILAAQAWYGRRSHQDFLTVLADAESQAQAKVAAIDRELQYTVDVVQRVEACHKTVVGILQEVQVEQTSIETRDLKMATQEHALAALTTAHQAALQESSVVLQTTEAAAQSQRDTHTAAHTKMLDDCFIQFHNRVDNRVKAEVAKWVFGTGGGGTVAAQQFCTRCTTRAARWHMLPDEGPVCDQCFTK